MRNKEIWKPSLTQKIFLTTTLILISTVLLIGFFIHRQSGAVYAEALDRAVQLIVQKYTSDIEDSFQKAETLKNTLRTEILSFVPQMEEEEDIFEQYKIYLRLKEKIDLLCEYSLGQNSAYHGYLLLHSEYPLASMFQAPDSSFLFENPTGNSLSFYIYSDAELKDEEWFRISSENQNTTYWFPTPGNQHAMTCAVNLSDVFLIDGEVRRYSLGTLVISIDISRAASYDSDNTFMDEVGVLITDPSYRILYSEDSSLLDRSLSDVVDEQEQLLSYGNTENTYQKFTIDGKEYHLWRQTILDDMHLFTIMPEERFSEQIWINMRTILVALLVILLVESVFAAFFSGLISQPIRRLSAHMKKSSMPTPITCAPKSGDEIGILYQTYNEMAEKQEQLIEQIYESAEQQKKLKYQMLQAQINPHFLYNTLDSVSCMAMINGEQELSRTLSALAKLFRYNIHQPDELVTLKEELEMMNHYIGIQQFRYENSICFSCKIPGEMLHTRVPKMILQPLVENGIYYGNVNKDGRRHLGIQAEFVTRVETGSGKEKELISIRISNERDKFLNSSGVEVEQLNDYLDGKCELKRRNGGLGILNVQERIRLSFGEAYGIHYESIGNQVIAVMELPSFI